MYGRFEQQIVRHSCMSSHKYIKLYKQLLLLFKSSLISCLTRTHTDTYAMRYDTFQVYAQNDNAE